MSLWYWQAPAEKRQAVHVRDPTRRTWLDIRSRADQVRYACYYYMGMSRPLPEHVSTARWMW